MVGSCVECPPPSFPVPSDRANTQVTFSLWTQKNIGGRKKFGLWNVTKTIKELSAELVADVKAMKCHIFTAAVCWERLGEDISQLRPGKDVLTFEDYQRNFELFHSEMPTSMGYAANNINLAMYPIGVKFRRPSPTEETPPVETGAVIFLSPDLHHDAQQVQLFERE